MSKRINIAAATALAAALAIPASALAQPRHHYSAQAAQGVPYGASVTDPSGNVVGADPDANIRFELRRDWGRGRD